MFRARSRSRSASSELDFTDSSVRMTRSRNDQQHDNSDFKLPAVFRVTCDLCGKRMLKDSLSRHMEKKHASDSQELEPEPASTRSGKIRKPVLPDLEAEEQPSTRSGRIRKHSFTIQPEIIEEPLNEVEDVSDKISCPMCFVRIAKLKFSEHFDELHSPARKITRKQFQVVVKSDDILTVHASTDSPCKIFNISSPNKNPLEDDDQDNTDFKKILSF